MANIYLGKDSCYARKGKYCPKKGKKGIDTREEVICITRRILKELKEGWTYNHSCERIRMTKKLARQRLKFLIKLACHYGSARLCAWTEAYIKRILARLSHTQYRNKRRKRGGRKK